MQSSENGGDLKSEWSEVPYLSDKIGYECVVGFSWWRVGQCPQVRNVFLASQLGNLLSVAHLCCEPHKLSASWRFGRNRSEVRNVRDMATLAFDRILWRILYILDILI